MASHEDFPGFVTQGVALGLDQGDLGALGNLAPDFYRFTFKTAGALNNISDGRLAEGEVAATGQCQQQAE